MLVSALFELVLMIEKADLIPIKSPKFINKAKKFFKIHSMRIVKSAHKKKALNNCTKLIFIKLITLILI